MASVLVLSGGPDHAHDFAATGDALVALLREAGHRVARSDDPDEAAEQLVGEDRPDALLINALRWRMHGDRYDPWRERWAYTTPPATRAAIDGFVRAGGGLVGNHTASICFDDWDGWAEVLGGAWDWARSSHPPLGPVRATRTTVGADHPVTAHLPDVLDLVDEVYGDQRLVPGVEVLATARRGPEDADQPVVWVHRHGQGRVVYDGFGHDVASITDPHHAELLRRAVDWVTEVR
jgi:hypothetical protein